MWYWDTDSTPSEARPLRFWIVSTGEPLPIDGDDVRLMRAGLLAAELVAAGHTVEWWSSTFDHPRGRTRCSGDRVIEIAPRCTLRLCHAPGYSRNRSVRRLRHQRQVARSFTTHTPGLPRPDAIVSCMPTIELSLAASRYATANRVPLAIDIRDKWPEALLNGLPPALREPARWAALPYRRALAAALREASSVVGVSPAFVRWGLDHAGRDAGSFDLAFPLSNSDETPTRESLDAAERSWAERGLGRDDPRPIAVFAGALSGHFDFTPIVAAARELAASGSPWRFVLAGTGPHLDDLRRRTRDLSNAIVPGRLDRPELWSLLARSTAGLAPYRVGPAFAGHIPNKIIEYLCSGLPVATTLPAPLHGVTTDGSASKCVRTYDGSDPRALVATLRRWETRGAEAEERRRRARALWAERFDCRKTYPAFRRHLERLASAATVAARPTASARSRTP